MSLDDTQGSSRGTGTVSELQEENLGSPQSAEPAPELHAEPAPEVHAETAAPRLEETAPEPREQTAGSSQSAEATPEVQIELPGITEEAPEAAEIDTLLADMEKAAGIQGKVVRGKVLKVTEAEVRVNVGTGLEGAVPLSEFLSMDGQLTVAPGDEVDFWVETYNAKQGTVTLSRQKAARLEVWEKIERAFRDQTMLTGRVLDRIKGGLTVDVGVLAFMPSSQADIRPLRNVESLLGREIECKVIKIIRKRSNVVVSRRLAMEEEANRRKAELLAQLKEGAQLVGRVKNLTDYGAFLDLSGMDGLLHVTDMAWGRVGRPSDVVHVGQELKVVVLKFDPEKGRISLGLKQLTPDPWEQVASACHVGDRVTGRVANVTDYGAFVEIKPGVEGLVHISEMSWGKRLKHPSKVLKSGDLADVVVLDVNPAQRRISLSLKQAMPDPWNAVSERYREGAVVEVTVTNLTDFGAFAEVDSDIEGLIHNSDLSWTKKVKHASEVLKKGQKVKAVVLSLDTAQRRLSLGVKQLEPDPWDGFMSKAHVGDLVKGKVARLAPFGAFVEVEQGVEGLCHTSEFGEEPGGGGKRKLEAGAELQFRVTRLDPAERKISLSLKPAASPAAASAKEERKTEGASPQPPAVASEQKKKPEAVTSMAEALSAAGITLSGTAKPAAAETPAVKPEQAAAAGGSQPQT
jgi:small subunit ribosomal protein S1